MERSDHSWIVSMQVMLGSLHHHQVQTCSISSVRDELRNPNEAAFKPKEVSVGPLHRGTTRRVRLMEETKWHFMSEFLDGAGTGIENQNKLLGECCIEILELDKIISASYGGNIESEPHELAKMMIVDGCFLLELLIRLGRYMESQDDDTSSRSYYDDPLLKSKKKIVSILNDITMLENQIPFIVLKKLYRTVFPNGSDIFNDHRVDHIVWKAFRYPVVSNLGGVHILHSIHLSTVEQNQEGGKRVKQDLLRCATRLRAAGIIIEAVQTTTCHDLVDWFNFEISFSGRVLKIPQLNIKETTEVRWRNLIAWEQSMIGVTCRYTSYALFFQGLVCCKHDIELLEEKKVIRNEAGKSKEELLNLFRTISKGAEIMDSSYKEICKRLSMYEEGKVRKTMRGLPIVTWHKCRHVFEITAYYWGNWYSILIRDHIPTVWRFIGVLAAAALLVLTIMQTYYSSRIGC